MERIQDIKMTTIDLKWEIKLLVEQLMELIGENVSVGEDNVYLILNQIDVRLELLTVMTPDPSQTPAGAKNIVLQQVACDLARSSIPQPRNVELSQLDAISQIEEDTWVKFLDAPEGEPVA